MHEALKWSFQFNNFSYAVGICERETDHYKTLLNIYLHCSGHFEIFTCSASAEPANNTHVINRSLYILPCPWVLQKNLMEIYRKWKHKACLFRPTTAQSETDWSESCLSPINCTRPILHRDEAGHFEHRLRMMHMLSFNRFVLLLSIEIAQSKYITWYLAMWSLVSLGNGWVYFRQLSVY